MMARYECVRCHAVLNTTMPPHLCRDVALRLDTMNVPAIPDKRSY